MRMNLLFRVVSQGTARLIDDVSNVILVYRDERGRLGASRSIARIASLADQARIIQSTSTRVTRLENFEQ